MWQEAERARRGGRPLAPIRPANAAAILEMGPANALRASFAQAGPKEVASASHSGETQGRAFALSRDERHCAAKCFQVEPAEAQREAGLYLSFDQLNKRPAR